MPECRYQVAGGFPQEGDLLVLLFVVIFAVVFAEPSSVFLMYAKYLPPEGKEVLLTTVTQRPRSIEVPSWRTLTGLQSQGKIIC